MNNFFSPDFYIGRNFELNEIKSGLAKNGIVAITGDAGVGKTVLSKFYAKQNIHEFSRVFFHNAAQFNHNFPVHIGTYLPVKTETPTLTIIDGIDEIGAAEYKAEGIVNEFLDAVTFGHKLILTYRNYIFRFGNPFNAYEIKLGGLSEIEASLLVEKLLSKNLGVKYSNDVKKILSIVQNNPLGIVAALDLLKSNILL